MLMKLTPGFLKHQMSLVEILYQVSKLRQEAVEEKGEDEAEERDGESNRIDVVLHQGLHVNLQRR